MANAKKCDRCGELYEIYEGIKFISEGNSYRFLTFYGQNSTHPYNFDLCPRCMTKAILFMERIVDIDLSDPDISDSVNWRLKDVSGD